MKQFSVALAAFGTNPNEDTAAAVLQAALSIARNRRRFEIGRALSFAPPGHDMDVVLM